MHNKTLIELAKEAYPALRKLIIYALVLGLGVAALVPDGEIQIGLITALVIAILFFIFDIHSALMKQLESIETKIPVLEAKPYPKFSFIESDLNQILNDWFSDRKLIHVEIIAVSASCTWPYFQENISQFIKKTTEKYNLKLDIIISSDETLQKWNAIEWLNHKRAVIAQYETFAKNHKEELQDRDIEITIYEYDNLPHWHGVMINRGTLFLGRTEWNKINTTGVWELKVGQVEYRRFDNDDNYGGTPRLLRFGQWADRYSDRSIELKKARDKLSDDEILACRLSQ